MKIQKKYIALVTILLIVTIFQFNTKVTDYSSVKEFRGANLEDDVFDPLIASSVNEAGSISIHLNNSQIPNNNYVMLNSSLVPMASEDFIMEYLGGSVFRSTDEDVTVQFMNDIFALVYDNIHANYNNNPITLKAEPFCRNGKTYIALEDVCAFLGGSMIYDMETGNLAISCKSASLPKKYDLRDYGRAGSVYNQGAESSCWAYAAISALESTILPFENRSFSISHMLSSTGFDHGESGDYTMALAYLLSWAGPFDGDSKEISNHVQKALFFDAGEIDDIKAAVYKYGGVTTSIYANISMSNLDTSSYYNNMTGGYCYMGTASPNHEVEIIGWDDMYSANNFNGNVTENGAFICQNSWGTSFGQNGVFYVSYQDATIGTQGVCYASVEANNNYDNIYQSDLCGWVGQVGYGKEMIYGANVYKAGSSEMLDAVGFYALEDDTRYQVYVVNNFNDTASFANRKLLCEGLLEGAGYYTIDFDSMIPLDSGEQFAVIVYLSSPSNTNPMAIEYQNDRLKQKVDLSDGHGYISKNGLDWERVETTCSANLCLKAYTKNVVK